MKLCFHCKKRLIVRAKPPRHETCPYCGNDLKACVNCRFFDSGSHNQCTEPMAERVCDKEKANFCEYFQFKRSASLNMPSRNNDPLENLKRLFNET